MVKGCFGRMGLLLLFQKPEWIPRAIPGRECQPERAVLCLSRVWVWMYNCGIIPLYYTTLLKEHCFIQHSQSWTAAKRVHEPGWASTRSRPGPPLCSIQNNLIVKSLQRGIQSSASGCSSSALIADMKLNFKRTPSTRMRMVVVVALMNLIALTYPRVSTACMTRTSSRPRRWWTRVTSTNEVVWVLYNTFGIIWYYTILYSAFRKDSNYTDS